MYQTLCQTLNLKGTKNDGQKQGNSYCLLVVDRMFLCKKKKKKENDMAKLLYMPGHGTSKMKLNFLKFSRGSRKKERKSYRQNLYHPQMVAHGTSEKLAVRLLFSLQSITIHPFTHTPSQPPIFILLQIPPSFSQGLPVNLSMNFTDF